MKVIKAILGILMVLGTGVMVLAMFAGRIGAVAGLAIIVLPVILIIVQLANLLRDPHGAVNFATIGPQDIPSDSNERSAADYIIEMLEERQGAHRKSSGKNNDKADSRSIEDYMVAARGEGSNYIQSDQLTETLEKLVLEQNHQLYQDVHILDVFELDESYVDFEIIKDLLIDYLVCGAEEIPVLIIMLRDSETDSAKEKALSVLMKESNLDLLKLESAEVYSIGDLRMKVNASLV